jgi:hypothetical protein
MRPTTYRHYPSFTRRYVRSVMKMMGLPKKPSVEAEIFFQTLHDHPVDGAPVAWVGTATQIDRCEGISWRAYRDRLAGCSTIFSRLK